MKGGFPVSQTSTSQAGNAKPVSRGNRRVTVRYRCAPATLGKVYLREDDQEYQRACVLNLSQTGIGLQLARPLDVGQSILVVIRSTDRSKVYELAGHVARCDSIPFDEWIVGCELMAPLS